MATKDHENFYSGLSGTIPNTVSRSIKVGDRSFHTVVSQSGKAILDSELQLTQDIRGFSNGVLNRHQAPSGWLRGQTRHDGYNDYGTVTSPNPFNDDSGGVHLDPNPGPGVLVNSFILPRLTAQVAGIPVVVEYTNTRDSEYNLVTLSDPTPYDGTPSTVKRTDFVFLEVWKALVAPSVASSGSVTVVDFSTIVALDTITIGGHALTAVAGAPAADEFQIGGTNDATATNIATAINLSTNWWFVNNSVKAKAFGHIVMVYALVPGVAGDAILMVLSNPGPVVISGPNLTGGADRPNKPAQNKLYVHGNVQSPSQVWLDDEITDPVVNRETTQRVQIQYRIRSTDSVEAVNYKSHPDGFSTKSGGVLTTLAWGGIGSGVAGYPFVPANRSSVSANSSAVDYDIEDPGLWVAGDGTAASAQALNSLDGFVYAIPICFVHRYNDASSGGGGGLGFNPDSNTNGAPLHNHAGYAGAIGVIPPGLSDRPDGDFADVVSQNNILDLRRHVIFPGIDTSSELQYQIQSLLDGSTRTWSMDAADKQTLGGGSGDVSTRFMVCNEIGRSAPHGGIGSATTRGDFVREFDHIARRFGDQAVVERLAVSFYPGDRDVAGGPAVLPGLLNDGKFVSKAGGSTSKWYDGDRLRLDLERLDSTTLGGIFQGLSGGGTSAGAPIFISDLLPLGTAITDVLAIRHDDGNSAAAIVQDVNVKSVIGLGTVCVDVTLDANPLLADGGSALAVYPLVDTGAGVSGSPRRIIIEFEVTYPIGVGSTDTVYVPLVPNSTVYDQSLGNGVGNGPMVAEDVTQQPADMEGLLPPNLRVGYRELHVEYVGNDTIAHGLPLLSHPIGSITPESVVSADVHTLYFPRRVYDSRFTKVTDTMAAAVVAVDPSLTEWGSSSRKVVTSGIISNSGQVLCDIEYFSQDPIPNYGVRGYQLGIYFRTHAPQTAGMSSLLPGTPASVLPTTLRVEPLYVSTDVWTNQVGSGSQDRGFPYAAPMDQIPINDGNLPTTLTHEWFMCATADMTVDDFNSDTGIMSLRPFVQSDGQNIMEFGGADAAIQPRWDKEFRAFYPWARDDLYRPTVLSQPLFGVVRHKVMFPFLARSLEEVPGSDGGILYRKNEVMLIVISRFAELDAENNVRFVDPVADNRTCAALYKTRNLLLVVGDRATMPLSLPH